MHQTYRLTVTNYNSWAWSYWKENLSYGNRQQIPNYLGSTSNLLSFDLKNCRFIAIFPEFIDFICSFVQWHNVSGLHTETERITNICVICQPKVINGTRLDLDVQSNKANPLQSKCLRDKKGKRTAEKKQK